MFKTITLLLASVLGTMSLALAEVIGQAVEYSDGGTALEGYVAREAATRGLQPGILIVHDWMGLGEFAKDKASKLAKDGFAAFAVDIYGKGVRPRDMTEAAKFAARYKDDRKLLRSRVRAAFDKLRSIKGVDPTRVIVIGYCFGGTAALELARGGAPVVATVSFHGGLSTPSPDDAKNIKGRVLVLHGADDPNVPPTEVQAFKDEMRKAGVDMKFVAYPGAVHAFTNPAAGSDKSKGVAYNAEADRKSWQEFQRFTWDVLKK